MFRRQCNGIQTHNKVEKGGEGIENGGSRKGMNKRNGEMIIILIEIENEKKIFYQILFSPPP